MITGSMVSTLFREPRMTHDIELILEPKANEIEAFSHALPPEAFYRPVKDVMF